MPQVTIKQLLEAGVHFGHQTQRWNPKMKKYIFGERNGIYIINLEITLTCIETAMAFLKQVAGQGREVLFVGTKKQAQEHIRDFAQQCEMPYVDQRWLGGMLTNFETVRRSVARLDAIDAMEKDGSFQFMKKKEVLTLNHERDKLLKNLKGVRPMRKLPGALFVIDSKKEEIAIKEARKLGIPVVAVLDTNCDPDLIDFPIPGNDDAIRSIKLFSGLVSEMVKAGREEFRLARKKEADDLAEAEAAEEAANLAAAAGGEDPDVEAVLEEPAEEKLAQKFAVEVDVEDDAKKLKKVVRKQSGRIKAK